MASIFTRIINGELPGRFVWRDDDVVAFLTIEPMGVGHTLVVPRQEVDHWIEMSPALNAKVFEVARIIGTAIQAAFNPTRVGVIIAGDEVPHTHVHVIGFQTVSQLSFAGADRNASAASLDAAAVAIRKELAAMGHASNLV